MAAMETPRLSVIEVTFDDGSSSDTIQFHPGDAVGGMDLCSWIKRRDGRKTTTGLHTTGAVAVYLFETAISGKHIDNESHDFLLGVELMKVYARCRLPDKGA